MTAGSPGSKNDFPERLIAEFPPQIVLAQYLPNVGRERMCRDMDEWGYTFRLGSAALWFDQDAEDARAWLIGHGVLDSQTCPTYACR